MRFAVVAVLVLALLAVGCREGGPIRGGSGTPSPVTSNGPPVSSVTAPPSPTATNVSAGAEPTATGVPGVDEVDYADPARWLCLPGRSEDLCEQGRRAQVLSANLEGWETSTQGAPASRESIDCFYVYPTVSTDLGVNSDLEPGLAERGVVIAQAAPFNSVCRVYAPVYRQLTLTALTTGRFGDAAGAATAYSDVVAAWDYYLAHHNEGRRVVVIGHSQGSSVLKKLIAERVDSNATVRGRLAAAFLLGTSVAVPEGEDVGGDFKNIPACRTAKQLGCVVSYSSFNEVSPPPALSLFGRVAGANNEALCVDPGDLTGHDLIVWLTNQAFRASARTGNAAGVSTDADYVVYSQLVASRCAKERGFSYLAVGVNAEGSAWGISIPPFITGEAWGLHNLDVSLALGNLVELVAGYATE